MLIGFDSNRLPSGMIEDLGRIAGVDSMGLGYDEYQKKVVETLKVPNVQGMGRDVADLSANGIKVYLFFLTGRPLQVRDYAEWLGKTEITSTVRKSFADGLEDLKSKKGKNRNKCEKQG